MELGGVSSADGTDLLAAAFDDVGRAPPKRRRGKPLDAAAPAGSEVIAPPALRRGRKPRSAAAE